VQPPSDRSNLTSSESRTKKEKDDKKKKKKKKDKRDERDRPEKTNGDKIRKSEQPIRPTENLRIKDGNPADSNKLILKITRKPKTEPPDIKRERLDAKEHVQEPKPRKDKSRKEIAEERHHERVKIEPKVEAKIKIEPREEKKPEKVQIESVPASSIGAKKSKYQIPRKEIPAEPVPGSEKSSSFSSPAKSVITSPDFPSSPGDHFHSTQHSRSSPNIAHSPKVQSPGSDFPFTDFESQNGSTRTTNNENSPMSKDEATAKSELHTELRTDSERILPESSPDSISDKNSSDSSSSSSSSSSPASDTEMKNLNLAQMQQVPHNYIRWRI
jgi:hypothetical protein